MAPTSFSTAGETPINSAEAALVAFGTVEATSEQLPTLRKNPPRPLPPRFFKYADDQAVAAVTAVFRAIHEHRLQDSDFTNWVVVAAPRFLGRVPFAAAIDKFQKVGAPTVSPLIVPYLSLHSISGSVSLALHCHGPNVGVGGGEGGLVQALLTGLTMAAEHRTPGVWVVLTESDPEPIADDAGRPAEPLSCRALALALAPSADQACLKLRWSEATHGRASTVAPDAPAPSLADLTSFLVGRPHRGSARRWVCPLNWGGCLELIDSSAVVLPAPGSPQPALAA